MYAVLYAAVLLGKRYRTRIRIELKLMSKAYRALNALRREQRVFNV